MKKILLFTGLLTLFFSSCNEEDKALIRENTGHAEELVVQAVMGDNTLTKTAVQSNNDIYWTQGDAINLFYGNNSSGKFTTSITQPSAVAAFQGTISGVVTGTNESGREAQSFWGVYPYNSSNTCDGSGVTLTIPSNQSGVAGTFADNLNPTVATAPGLDLAFYNVGSWFGFTVTRSDIASVTFRGNAQEDVVGTVRVEMDANSRPVVTQITNGIKSITMTPEGGGCFTPGQRYYMVLIPQTLSNGYNVTLTTQGGSTSTFTYNQSWTFSRSVADGKINIDQNLIFNIEFRDAKVKEICVKLWDTDKDGELSYAEAAAVTAIPYSAFAENTEITSFDEFQYFTGVTSMGYESDYDKGMDYYGAFYNCTSLQSIVLPPTLQTITWACFRECSALEDIVIPSSVTKIQQIAFLDCTKLIVHMESETPCTLEKDIYDTYDDPYVFGYLTGGRVKAILVPSDEAVTNYKGSQFWPSSLIHKEGWTDPSQIITFKDAITELICVTLWDTNGDNYLSLGEAAAVTDITTQFKGSEITSFDELQFFTGLSSIPDESFKNCTKLKSISFPSSLTSISSSALSGCSQLIKITVPSIDMWINLVGTIKPFTRNGELFVGDNLVTEIVIPDGTQNLPGYLFQYLYKIEKVVLPEGLKSIGDFAFFNCNSLSDINIPASLKTIGKSAFRVCKSLSEISVGDVTSIGDYAFCGCDNLIEIDLRSATSIPYGICQSCTSLTDVYLPNVQTIGRNAFKGCTELTIVDIPATVSTIQECAFDGCTKLYQVNFSDEGLTTLGNAVFYRCSSLKEISLPKTLVNVLPSFSCSSDNYVMGYGAFYQSGLEKIECYDPMLEHITVQGYNNSKDVCKLAVAFSYIRNAYQIDVLYDNSWSSVKEIVINKTNITYSIPDYAFDGFSNLETISLPSGTTSIGNYAFRGCSKLEGITLYNTISSIGFSAFRSCSSLTSVSIPNGITTISSNAFSYCRGLTSLNVSASVTSIEGAFQGCSGLTSIIVDSNNSVYDSRNNCNAIIRKADNTLIFGCQNTIIPNTVTSINSYAFYYCSNLTSITIPENVTSIGGYAFDGCNNLQSIIVLPTTPPTGGGGMFPSSCIITVPYGTRDAYVAAWPGYTSRIVEATE